MPVNILALQKAEFSRWEQVVRGGCLGLHRMLGWIIGKRGKRCGGQIWEAIEITEMHHGRALM